MRLALHTRSGFTLIEVLISSAIASLICGILFFAFNQSSKLLPVIDSYTDVYTKAAILNMQLERDLSGVFAPNEYYARQKKKESPQQKEEAEKKTQENEKKETAPKDAQSSEKKEPKPLEKLFYGITKDDTFDYLTFITDNPLAVYWSEKSGSARPRVVRVVYRLQEEKQNKKGKKSYQLLRQESESLEFNAMQNESEQAPREYIIADGIKELNVKYTALVSPQPDEKNPEQNKKKEIKKFKQWVQTPEKEKDAKEKLPIVPQLTEMNIVFWDYQKKRTFPFSFKIYNRADIQEERKEVDATGRLMQKIRELVTVPEAPKNGSNKQVSYVPPKRPFGR